MKQSKVIAVDLDGTLTLTDILNFFAFNPLQIIKIIECWPYEIVVYLKLFFALVIF